MTTTTIANACSNGSAPHRLKEDGLRRALSYADQQPLGQYEPENSFSYRLLGRRDLGFSVLQYFYVSAQKIASIPYSQFEQLLHEHKVSEVGVSDRYLQGKLKEPLPDGKASS